MHQEIAQGCALMCLEDVPLVSIVMPAYNSQSYIRSAIDSVLAQTFKGWELLVIDDSSIDNTAEYVRAYSDRRIRYLKNAQNLGVAETRNKAIEIARGKYIAFLDSDDVWLPYKLAAQVELLEQGAVICYGSYARMSSDGRLLNKVIAPASLRYSDMLKSNSIGHLTGIYRKDSFPNLRFESCGHEDYVFGCAQLRFRAKCTPPCLIPSGTLSRAEKFIVIKQVKSNSVAMVFTEKP